MARKVNLGNGKFIEQTNKKRPGRHSKSPNKRNTRKEYKGQGRKQYLNAQKLNGRIVYTII